jgi:O-antigen/teichoic acid export membrane protein
MGLLQFGIAPAIVRYVARYKALNDREKLNQIYSSFFIIFIFIGLFCALLISGWALIFPEILAEEGMPAQKYSLFLLIIACQMLEIFPGIVIQCFHEGFQRYNLINCITAVQIISTNAIIYYMLKSGHGLVTFALVTTISYFIKLLILWSLLLRHRYGKFSLKIKYINKNSIKELYLFGFKSFVLGMSGRIAFNTDSIVIGSFMGPAIVPYYIIPVNLINKIKGIMMSITLGFMPHFSELHAKGNKDEIITSFLSYSRYAAGIALYMLLGVFFLGLPFINIWIGSEYGEQGKYILYIIGIAFFLPLLNPFQGRMLTSMGKHGVLAKIAIPVALLNISLSLILVNYYGLEGVALGTLIPAVLAEPMVFIQVSKIVGFKKRLFIKSVLLPQLFPVLITGLLYFILSDYIVPDNYINIILTVVICTVVYFSLFLLFIVTKDERRKVLFKIKKIAMKQ